MTDPNGATTTYAHDVFGRRTAQRRPGDESGPATLAFTYTDTAPYHVQVDRRQDASTVQTSPSSAQYSFFRYKSPQYGSK